MGINGDYAVNIFSDLTTDELKEAWEVTKRTKIERSKFDFWAHYSLEVRTKRYRLKIPYLRWAEEMDELYGDGTIVVPYFF